MAPTPQPRGVVRSLAAVVIASEKRRALLPEILASIEGCDERIVVGDWPANGAPHHADGMPYEYFCVPPMTRTTVDALVKRDVGALASRSDAVLYLCDDHKLDPAFVRRFWDGYARMEAGVAWDVLVPARYTRRAEQSEEPIWLNTGRKENYAGGHCAIYRRMCMHFLPWAATHHHPNWDVLQSRQLQKRGFRFCYAAQDLAVEDIEWKINPESKPWL